MANRQFETKTRDELERQGTKYEEIGAAAPNEAPAIQFLETTAGCTNARVNCCGTFFDICMVPGVWYCCRNGTCKTCYKI